VHVKVAQLALFPPGGLAGFEPEPRGASRRDRTTSGVILLSLIVALAATIAALALAWARNGAVAGLLDTVLQQVRGMLGIG
jgi:hypothetical protein